MFNKSGMIMQMLRTILISCLLLPAVISSAYAQQGDTLDAMRAFVRACRQYQQLPLQASMKMACHSNVLTSPGDTMQVEAAFYLDRHGSYVRMGELEQLANDSLLLLVSHEAHRMMLYANSRSTAQQLQSYMGMQLADSSIAGLARKYLAEAGAREGNMIRYSLKSRAFLYGTSLPRESISIDYDIAAQRPMKIVQLKRSLVPTDSLNYIHLQTMPAWEGKLLELPDKGWFVIKELTTDYVYSNISHKENLPLPVRMADRIVATAAGAYAPVKDYDQFILNQSTPY